MCVGGVGGTYTDEVVASKWNIRWNIPDIMEHKSTPHFRLLRWMKHLAYQIKLKCKERNKENHTKKVNNLRKKYSWVEELHCLDLELCNVHMFSLPFSPLSTIGFSTGGMIIRTKVEFWVKGPQQMEDDWANDTYMSSIKMMHKDR